MRDWDPFIQLKPRSHRPNWNSNKIPILSSHLPLIYLPLLLSKDPCLASCFPHLELDEVSDDGFCSLHSPLHSLHPMLILPPVMHKFKWVLPIFLKLSVCCVTDHSHFCVWLCAGAPVTLKVHLAFCGYNGSSCCSAADDSAIQKQFKSMNISDAPCASLVQSILCAVRFVFTHYPSLFL